MMTEITTKIEEKIKSKEEDIRWLELQLSEAKVARDTFASVKVMLQNGDDAKPVTKRTYRTKNKRAGLKAGKSAYKCYRLIEGHGPLSYRKLDQLLGTWASTFINPHIKNNRYFKVLTDGRVDIIEGHMPKGPTP